VKTQNLRFLNNEARTYHGLQEARLGAPTIRVLWEPLFGTEEQRLTPEAYQLLEDYVYMQARAGLNLEQQLVAVEEAPDYSLPLPMVEAELEALIRLTSVQGVQGL
jgi:hypothetical protein